MILETAEKNLEAVNFLIRAKYQSKIIEHD